MTETTNNLRYDDNQEEQLLENYAKRNKMSVSRIFSLDDHDIPKISLQKSDEGLNIFSTVGLGHINMLNGSDYTGIELMMTASENFDSEELDSLEVVLNELTKLCFDHLSSEGDYMINCTDVSESFRERFGYDHILFVERTGSIGLKNLGPIYMRIAVPLYEEEWKYICGKKMDSDSLERYIMSLVKWYDDHDVIVGAVDVERDVIAPAKSVCH